MIAQHVDVGSACVDIRQSPKMDVLVLLLTRILCIVTVDKTCTLMEGIIDT